MYILYMCVCVCVCVYGTANTEVHTEVLKKASENDTQGHIEGYYLYIAVSVLEKASE